MSAESSDTDSFEIKFGEEVQESLVIDSLVSPMISDDKIIELIVKELSPKRRVLAGNQIKIYFNKLMSHPGMRLKYIEKIKQLVIYEKNLNKKRVELNYE